MMALQTDIANLLCAQRSRRSKKSGFASLSTRAGKIVQGPRAVMPGPISRSCRLGLTVWGKRFFCALPRLPVLRNFFLGGRRFLVYGRAQLPVADELLERFERQGAAEKVALVAPTPASGQKVALLG